MKKITAIIPFFLFCSAWASEDCKNRAQTFVEIREDYKNLAELRADLKVSQAHNDIIRQLGGASAAEDGRIQLMELYGPFVFNYYKGLKGDKLYKRAYDECVAEKKVSADRRDRQEIQQNPDPLTKLFHCDRLV